MDKIDAQELIERQKSYLQTHYLGLHVTIVSVALATAGLTAGSLLGRDLTSGVDLLQLWLLWAASLLATAAAYAGPMVGVFAVRASVPVITDLLLPLALGVIEFLLYAVLAPQVTGIINLDSVIDVWFIVMALFAAAAVASVQQARHYYDKDAYTEDLVVIECYLWRLRAEQVGAGTLFVIASVGAGLRLAGLNWMWLSLVSSSAIIVVLLLGLVAHHKTAKMWRTHFPFKPESEKCGEPCIPAELRLLLRIGTLVRAVWIPTKPSPSR
jgi:hypothetical protein